MHGMTLTFLIARFTSGTLYDGYLIMFLLCLFFDTLLHLVLSIILVIFNFNVVLTFISYILLLNIDCCLFLTKK